MLAEGGEEVGSDAINLFGDLFISGEKSELRQTIREKGLVEALCDQALSMGLSFAGGAISGGTLAIPGAAMQAVSVQAELREQQRQERIREIGARFDQTGDIRLLDELFELALDDKGEMTEEDWYQALGVDPDTESKQEEGLHQEENDDTIITASGERKGWIKPVPQAKRKIQQGFEAFPDGDILKSYIQSVKPFKNCYDIAMHGTPDSVCFGTKTSSMDARDLARVILHDPDYRHGQPVRLLACSTGQRVTPESYCFAEELANALGAVVYAPNLKMYIQPNGNYYVGQWKEGRMIEFVPNKRRRRK